MKIIFSALVFLSCSTAFSQYGFPENWLGHYQGDLKIYSADSVRMKIDMELKIERTASDSIYNWTLVYDPNGRNDRRAYKLLVIDREKGHYQIDEQNSIIIDAYMYNKEILTSFFMVSKSYVLAIYSKVENAIKFEIIAGKGEPVGISGKTVFKGEEIPEVRSFQVNGRQEALLKRLMK